jgi:hypothetical protein
MSKYKHTIVADLGGKGLGAISPILKTFFQFLPAEKIRKWTIATSNGLQNMFFDNDRSTALQSVAPPPPPNHKNSRSATDIQYM